MADGEAMEPGPAKPGHEAPKCGGTNRKGKPCGNAAGYKTDHVGRANCAFHGGSTPTGQQYAERIAAEQAVAAFGLQLDGTPPGRILLREIARSSGMVGHLAVMVSELTPEDLSWGLAGRRITQPTTPGGQPQVVVEQRGRTHPLVVMLRDERRTLRELIEAAHRAGVEERQLALAERDGAQIAAAFYGLFAELRREWTLTAEQQEQVRAMIVRQMRQMAVIESGKSDG
jgi:hypothetical protein